MSRAGRVLAIANRHPRLRFDRRQLARAVAALDARAGRFRGGCPAGELSVVFLTDAALARLHADYLGDPAPTDVITFGGDPALGAAGEICVSADAATRQAPATGRRRSEELARYVIHGWLHLAGYDDRTPAARQAMRRAEARALAIWRSGGRTPRFAFRAFSVRSRAPRP
jgi:probable rRNA maturation factor